MEWENGGEEVKNGMHSSTNSSEERVKKTKRDQIRYLYKYPRYRVMTRVDGAPPSVSVAVLNPSWRMTASRSAFCTGFDSVAAKSVLANPSDPL